MAHEPAERIPDEHRLLTGKRRSVRERRQINVWLKGSSKQKFQARTIDVSRGGMLVELTDPTFTEIGGGAGVDRFMSLAARVSTEFAGGMKVNFGALGVRTKAEMIRLVTRIQDMAFLLGCRFKPDLNDKECRLLGLDSQLDETQVEAILSIPLHAEHPHLSQPPAQAEKHPAQGNGVQNPEHPLSPGPGKGR